MFDEAYQMMYGPQGSQLQYSVNIVGLYKTQGTIWTKGKKSKFIDEKYVAWNDDVTYYRLERKKKTITIFGAHSEERDKYASKFKFSPDNYTYSIKDDPQKGYYITLKAKKNVKGIKEARVLLDHHTHYPINVRVKVGIFHTTIKISNFKVGGITDQLFVFPEIPIRKRLQVHRQTIKPMKKTIILSAFLVFLHHGEGTRQTLC